MSEHHFSLIDGSQVPDFVAWVARQALIDHTHFPKARPTGLDLIKMRCTEWRGLHERLASTVYNKTRWSLRAHEAEQDE